jgi:hypothetical protein
MMLVSSKRTLPACGPLTLASDVFDVFVIAIGSGALFGLAHADKTAAIAILFHRFSHNGRLAPQPAFDGQVAVFVTRLRLECAAWPAG